MDLKEMHSVTGVLINNNINYNLEEIPSTSIVYTHRSYRITIN